MTFSENKSWSFSLSTTLGFFESVKDLALDPEVNLNWRSHVGNTPFFEACSHSRVNIVRFMLDFHDNQRVIYYNSVNDNGQTPFFWACVVEHVEVVEILLANEKIDVNLPDKDGRTPLWASALCGRIEIVKRLLATWRKIDYLGRDWKGRTPGEIARKGKKGEIAALIEDFEKDPEKVRFQLRRELGYSEEPYAGELFALSVFLSDGYLKIPEAEES